MIEQPIITIQTEAYLYTPLIAEQVSLESQRAGGPGRLTFQVVKDSVIDFREGDHVVLRLGADVLFSGFVFTKRRRFGGVITVTAYDQIRYLKNRDTVSYESLTASGLVRRVAEDWGLAVGEIEQTGYVLPDRVEQNRPLLDMVQHAIDLTAVQAGRLFVLFDQAGALCLRQVQNMALDTVIHAGSIGDFDYTSTIDRGAYSAVRVYRPGAEEGETVFYGARREDLVRRWGILRHVSRLEEEMDGPEQAEALMVHYGRETRRLRVTDAVGDRRVRGGSVVPTELYLGDIVVGEMLMVERVVHRFREGGHWMDLTLVGGGFVE